MVAARDAATTGMARSQAARMLTTGMPKLA